jgi:hypothetical protein
MGKLLVVGLLALLPFGKDLGSRPQQEKLIGAGTVVLAPQGQPRGNNFSVTRETVRWETGLSSPSAGRLYELQTRVSDARKHNLAVLLTLTPDWERLEQSMPQTRRSQKQFCSYAASLAHALPEVEMFEIGNEPNNNYFFQPHFSYRGRSLAPRIYTRILARCYDSLKAAGLARGRPVTVVGGALASVGSDNPFSLKPTHSVCRFLRQMGRQLIVMGRELPVMDVLSTHPYGQTNTEHPARRHKGCVIGFADYTKLRRVMYRSFELTAQPAGIPVLYSEYAVQTTVPHHRLDDGYSHEETVTAVSSRKQGVFYSEAIRLTYCTPNVKGLVFLHHVDEHDLRRWQGGLHYADGSEKLSASMVRKAVEAVEQKEMSCG